ncbi:MAG: tetratricopeptide repeat protein [Bacteroidetes bacterium]|nr:tetratricopeptide repeat protein [Bacteroidota bacterium]
MSKEQDQPIVDVRQVYGKTEKYIEDNKKSLTVIVVAIVIIVVLYFGYLKLWIGPQEEEARGQMFMAERWFEKDSLRLAVNGDGNFLGFKDIIDQYGATPSSNLAHYYLGISYLKQKEYENAIETLKGFDDDDEVLYSIANGAIGDAYTELNNPADALSYYLSAANDKKNNFTSPVYLMKAARTYEDLGKWKEAVNLYDRLKKEYSNTQEGRDAEKYMARAKAEGGK